MMGAHDKEGDAMPDRTHTETIRFDPATGLYFAWRGSHTVNVRHSPDGDDVDCFSFGYGPGRPELTVDDFHEHVEDWLKENGYAVNDFVYMWREL